jgi:FMN-dependent oxidoreductase (nitrilotriacetate monooxygenase family)
MCSRDAAIASNVPDMSTHIILGAMFRALGAYPSGWRYPGAHNDPRKDAAVLRKTAKLAEAAKLDYLFFGDWLATGPDLEFTDPYLLARIDPISAIGYLAGITRKIGLIATANATYSDPYSLARQAASIDLLSAGRAGLNVVTGVEPRTAANHGRDAHWGTEHRYDRASEFVEAMRLLWDSWEYDAFVRNTASGVLIDAERLHPADYVGEHISVSGPLNVVRPIQGHLPIMHAGRSRNSLQLMREAADLALVAFPSLQEAVAFTTDIKWHVASAGRDPSGFKIIAPVLPVVAQTTGQAQEIFDRLLTLIPLEGDPVISDAPDFPANRSIRALSAAVSVPLGTGSIDTEVSRRTAARLNAHGQQLLETVIESTGRGLGGDRPVTYRHLLAAHVTPAPAVVGDPARVADYFETWFHSGAVDGFNVLSAFLGGQFEAFATLVVPELRRRGLFRTEYEGSTLREHLGLPRPENSHVAARAGASAAARAAEAVSA